MGAGLGDRPEPFIVGELAAQLALLFFEIPKVRLGHNHRAIDKDTKFDCPLTEHARRDGELVHALDCEKCRYRDGHGNQQTGTDVRE